MTQENIRNSVRAIIAETPEKLPAEIARELKITELQAVENLPEEMVTLLDGSLFETLTEEFRTWGDVLTVIDVEGHIFELLGPFPKGGKKFGYYNMSDRNTLLKGHLKLEGFSKIALVSKPFHGVETRSVQFFSHHGKTVFKLYIRRSLNETGDKTFVTEQLEKFEALKKLAA
ncbi:heme utilization cystosolic carrier protein HutX [Endozoicomonas sp. OPT23]|uniref:heme utilization cystosolic carrier protein HutX n=1 Tax=Endozoicomonas sp. OPT23 TaxID=2072845 RepID=UPI00129A8C90|nr:heme utilization cystosolic carrier protein HutX [Endozoicomonas sp. OPT23]MRI33082.1 heme utilization cystosolic carrier protein HutX [Endozoicomonas sp. OPT23]